LDDKLKIKKQRLKREKKELLFSLPIKSENYFSKFRMLIS